jgi:hypothetical protein
MIINTDITTPYKTTASNPLQTLIKVGKGTLEKVTIDVPDGPNWELYVRLRHMEHTIIPYDDDEWLAVNGHLYAFTPQFSKWKDVYVVNIETCSPQARYDHTIQVTMEINEIGTVSELLGRLLKFGQP